MLLLKITRQISELYTIYERFFSQQKSIRRDETKQPRQTDIRRGISCKLITQADFNHADAMYKAALYLPSRIVWDVNLARKLHYIRETRCRESSKRRHNARTSGRGHADKIQTELRGRRIAAPGASTVSGRTGEPGDSFHRSPSSRLARVRGYTAIPKYSGVVIFSGHTRPTTGRACTRARTIYTSSLLNSVNGQPDAEF